MKIILVHGDHSLKSYERLQKLIEAAKDRGWSVKRITTDGKYTVPEQFSADHLFEKESLYIIQDLTKLKKKDLEWLKKNNKKMDGTVVIYDSSEVSKGLIKSLPTISKTEEYKLPKLIFKFLESLYPGNSENSIKLFHKVINNEKPEFVFNLLARHFRDLYWVHLDSKSLPYPAWRIAKLKKQANQFRKEELLNIINALAEDDIRIKTSMITTTDAIDFIIASLLE